MATEVRWRRGTTAENDNFTGAEGEITVDMDKKLIRVHDGVSQGGNPLDVGAVNSTAYSTLADALAAQDGKRVSVWLMSDDTLTTNFSQDLTGIDLRVKKGKTLTLDGISTIGFNIIVEDGGQVLLDQDCTINGNIRSEGNTSGVVAFDAVTGDETLTINGGIDAGLWQVFGDSLSVLLNNTSLLDVNWFGLDGSNDQDAINKAISALAGNSGTVWLNGESFTISNVVNLAANLSIVGNGIYHTTVYAASALSGTNGCFTGSEIDNFLMRDFSFDGQGNDLVFCYIDDTNDLIFDRLGIYDVTDPSLTDSDSSDAGGIRINGNGYKNFSFTNCVGSDTNGIDLSETGMIAVGGMTQGVISGNIFTAGPRSQIEVIVWGEPTSDTTISNNVLINSVKHGIDYEHADNIIVDGNIIIGATHQGVSGSGSSGTSTVTNNVIYNITLEGIELRSGVGNIIQGNYVKGCGETGIKDQGDGHANVTENFVDDCGGDPNDTHPSALYITSPYAIVGNNIVINSKSSADNALMVFGNNSKIFNNIVGVNPNIGIDLECNDSYISGNYVYDSQNMGIYANRIDNAIITGNHCYNNGLDDTLSDASRAGLRVRESNSEKVIVTENVLRNNGSYGAYLESGLSIYFNHNVLEGNTAGAVYGFTKGGQNIGYVTENKGIYTFSSDSTSELFDHGLDITPSASDVMITPNSDLGSASYFWVSDINDDSVTINVDVAPGEDVDFAWKIGM